MAEISRFINSSNSFGLFIGSLCILVVILGKFIGPHRINLKKLILLRNAIVREKKAKGELFVHIEALPNFNWKNEEPLQLRPFKPKYHLTMALSNSDHSELILMDKQYLDRITLRRKVMHDHSRAVLGANPKITKAAQELYSWVMGDYLPRRYPTMFQVQATSHGMYVQNLVTKELLPLKAPADGKTCLCILGGHIDQDFLLLLPESADEAINDDPKYKLEGFITCWPSGFKASDKLNLRLVDIHAPVPGYASKLEKSMDRFFASLPVGKVVKRVNWNVQPHENLFAADEKNHSYNHDEADEEKDVDIDKTYLRCERQTLHRLPESKALVFSFKTYLYPVRQVKEEGLGEELATAIEGMKEGNVPDMYRYKSAPIWASSVKSFLRA